LQHRWKSCKQRASHAAQVSCEISDPVLQTDRMDPVIRKYTSFDEMKADEYRYWQSRPAHERLDAIEEMILTAYALKGWEMEPDVPRLQRPFVRLPCPWR
jgi:hypothetical protein